MATDAPRRISNLAVAGACAAFVAGMVGMAYGSVPLYTLFCQVTGYGGTTQRATEASAVVLDREMTIHFDTNVGTGLAMEFAPERRDLVMRIGETVTAHFRARNRSNQPMVAQAVYNVTPPNAGGYFNKLECFCFTEMTLKPGEEIEIPVVFFVDPAIVDQPETAGINTITLSYTFYPSKDDKPVALAPADTTQANNKLGG